jgi:hypothetical protein
MAYTAPTRDILREALARDLRDPGMQTFVQAELDDLLNGAVVEVSRVYPKEGVISLVHQQDQQRAFAVDAYALFRVELLDSEGNVAAGISRNNMGDHAESGWDFHGGYLYLPRYIYGLLAFEDGQSLRVWGYFPRNVFTDDTDVLDGDAECEFAVRAVAALNGYQRLQNDRLLFQQWLTNTGNTDVSPNQLAQTADMYQSQWREMRNRIRIIQRQ